MREQDVYIKLSCSKLTFVDFEQDVVLPRSDLVYPVFCLFFGTREHGSVTVTDTVTVTHGLCK